MIGNLGVSKRVWNNKAGTGNPTNDLKFVYDGWNLLASLNATNNNILQSFVWGTDLSGSKQLAGGVGGILEVVNGGNTRFFAACDGGGNLVGLVDASNGALSAAYGYGPFSEPIRANGTFANLNPFRFSSKYQDPETDLLYYGFRYLSADSSKWLNRDPSDEIASKNLLGFIRNDPINRCDSLGREEFLWRLPDANPNGKAYQDSDGYITAGGTGWEKFEPKVHVYTRPNDPCCFGLMFEGHYAQVHTWWDPTYPEAAPHEITHIRNYYYPSYVGFKPKPKPILRPARPEVQQSA
jgi:RHS repeat-associated protein